MIERVQGRCRKHPPGSCLLGGDCDHVERRYTKEEIIAMLHDSHDQIWRSNDREAIIAWAERNL